MIEQKQVISAGKFLKTHGLDGELNAVSEYPVEIYTSETPVIVEIEGILVPFYIKSIRPKGSFSALVCLEGKESLMKCSYFVGREFYLLREDVAKFLDLDVEEIETEEDLEGFRVTDEKFGPIGKVTGMDCSTQNILLLVEPFGGESGSIIYIPFTDDFIISEEEYEDDETDEYGCRGNLLMNLPEGLLEININRNSEDSSGSDD